VIEWGAARLARAADAQLSSGDGQLSGGDAQLPSGDGQLSGGDAQLSGGDADRGPVRAVIDSRQVRPGDLFVGLAGEREDGGAYAEQALRAGAWGVLVTPDRAEALLAAGAEASVSAVAPRAVLAHPDPLAGLQTLASAWRRELGAHVVAITGSTGKTSTKDILAAILSGELRTVASPQNLNTEIGLPLAVLSAPPGTQALVLELAMRGAGQIAQLTAICEPDVGVIVNVGPVHLEQLGSLEGVAAAKAELIAGMRAGATVVLPHDEPLLDPHRREDLRTVTFGAGGDVQLLAQRAGEVTIGIGAQRIVLEPSFSQSHNLHNLLAAVAGARALGVTPGGRLEVSFSARRGERHALPKEIVLIDDCYNANPISMRAALDDLARTAPVRRVAVLGDMLELGAQAPGFHREVGEYARTAGVQLLLTVGPLATDIGRGFGIDDVHAVADAAAAAELLPRLLAPRDTVLVKGSRGVGLERVVQALLAKPAGPLLEEPAGRQTRVGG
jgi:UDP-N-acetylmuramoyl-tripeptide--D-alanyl-D-alanine ligase